MELVGKSLGRYQIVSKLGRGGMSEVYKAFQSGLNRYVAIKVLRIKDQETIARFEREAVAIGRLRHPNIVQAFDFDNQDDMFFMVMEFIDGPTLEDEIKIRQRKNKPFTLPEICRIFMALCAAIDEAHSQDMIHRDIKPANVMITKKGQIVLTDFGIAHIIDADRYTQQGDLIGTPAYMSPEQGQSHAIDTRSDIYSLGVILYEMVTGIIPYDADTSIAIVLKHIHEPLIAPSKINPSLPKSVERVITKAMSKHPDDRYQTAGEMAQALQKAVGLPPGDILQTNPLQLLTLPESALKESVTEENGATVQAKDSSSNSESTHPKKSGKTLDKQKSRAEKPPKSEKSVDTDKRTKVKSKADETREAPYPPLTHSSFPFISRPFIMLILVVLLLSSWLIYLLWPTTEGNSAFLAATETVSPTPGETDITATSTTIAIAETVRPTQTQTPKPISSKRPQIVTPIQMVQTTQTALFRQTSATETSEGQKNSAKTTTSTKEATPTNTPTETNNLPTFVPIQPTLSFVQIVISVQSQGDGHDLNLITPQGEFIRTLHRFAASPTIAPDGNRIAFVGKPEISTLGSAYSTGAGIWIIDLTQEGPPTQLISMRHIKNLAWSPDGGKIAFEFAPPGEDNQIVVIDSIEGREIARFPGREPAWSPDGQKLVLNRACAPACGLWISNFDGGDLSPLTENGNDSYPSWSPKGDHIAFTRRVEDTNLEIYRINLESAETENLTNHPNTDITPVYSPDGEEIYFRSDRGGSWRILALNVEEGEIRLIQEGIGPSDDWGMARPAVQ